MNTLPTCLEKIIYDYKYQLEKSEHQEKFSKCVKQLSNLKYNEGSRGNELELRNCEIFVKRNPRYYNFFGRRYRSKNNIFSYGFCYITFYIEDKELYYCMENEDEGIDSNCYYEWFL